MSPIEEMLWAELQPVAAGLGWGIERGYWMGGYQPDMTIVHGTPRGLVALVVECDGHDFHDRTKEQAEHDRRRDRFFLSAAGAPTVRFTGREIHRSAEDCAYEVVEIFQALIRERMATRAADLDGLLAGVI